MKWSNQLKDGYCDSCSAPSSSYRRDDYLQQCDLCRKVEMATNLIDGNCAACNEKIEKAAFKKCIKCQKETYGYYLKEGVCLTCEAEQQKRHNHFPCKSCGRLTDAKQLNLRGDCEDCESTIQHKCQWCQEFFDPIDLSDGTCFACHKEINGE